MFRQINNTGGDGMNELYSTIATSGICAVLLAAVLFGVYKIAVSLINGVSEMIKNAVFQVSIDSKDNRKKED